MEEAPKNGEGPTPPPRKNPNAAVLCACRKPARLVIVPTSYMPGQRCWRCANPDVQCGFCHWHGPWINERSNIRFNEMDRNPDVEDHDDRTDEQAATPAPPPVSSRLTRANFVGYSIPRARASMSSSSNNQNEG